MSNCPHTNLKAVFTTERTDIGGWAAVVTSFRCARCDAEFSVVGLPVVDAPDGTIACTDRSGKLACIPLEPVASRSIVAVPFADLKPA